MSPRDTFDLDDLDDLDPDGAHPPSTRRTTTRRSPARRTDLSELTGPHPDDVSRADASDPDPTDASDPDSADPDPGTSPGENYSTWGDAQHGPTPRPEWVITALGAIDTELGVVKTGKEADVHLLQREDRMRGSSTLMAAKRYRSSEHRLFHRDAGYLEGRRVRRSREMRAMARRTEFGRDLIGGQWARAEFEALSMLWSLTRPTPSEEAVDGAARALVPYPVQVDGRELLMEFIGEGRTAAPRLAETRPDGEQLVDLWHQAISALGTLALAGLAHGDLSAYNILVHRGRLVLIDLPQVVDVVANPKGPYFLTRDVTNLARWFRSRGLPEELCDVPQLVADLACDAGIRSPVG